MNRRGFPHAGFPQARFPQVGFLQAGFSQAGFSQAGFSLVELLTVLAIVSVLAALTLPGFRDQVLKGRRAEARDALQSIQIAQERFRARSPRYADRLDDLAQPATTQGGLYRLRIVQADATRYRVEAVAQGNQSADRRCQVLTLRLELGSVITTGFDDRGAEQADACWPR